MTYSHHYKTSLFLAIKTMEREITIGADRAHLLNMKEEYRAIIEDPKFRSHNPFRQMHYSGNSVLRSWHPIVTQFKQAI